MTTSQDTFVGKTLDFDTHESLLQPNAVAYMLNGDFKGDENLGNDLFAQNTLSNELCYAFPDTWVFRGSIRLKNDRYLLFFNTPGDGADSSEIGILDTTSCAYITKINNPCLDFKGEIRGTSKTIHGCNTERAYFIEKGGPIRYIDVDDCLPKKNAADCFDCDKNLQLDCSAFNLNRCVKFPKINFIESVGNLPNGSYQVAIALTDNEQRFTEYYVYQEVIKFHTNNQSTNRFGIEVEFKTCPQGFDQYELVLISNTAGKGTVAQRIGYFDVEQTKVFISELDDTTYSPIDFSVLGEVFPHYQSAEGIAQNNEQLILTGVTYRPQLNYQPKANQIRSKWVEYKVPARDAKKYKSFMRGEVYGFEIAGVYCDGERTPRYHIPCDAEYKIKSKRNGTTTWNALFNPVNNADVCEVNDPCQEGLSVPYWQIYDSAVVDPTPSDTNELPYCAQILTGDYQQVDDFCQGQVPPVPFTRQDKFISIKVYNKYCELTPTNAQVTVTANFDRTLCDGSHELFSQVLILPVGQEQLLFTWVAYQKVDCGIGTCVDETTDLVNLNIATSLQQCPEGPMDWCETRVDPCGGVSKTGDFGHWESSLNYPNNPCVWGQRTDPEAAYYDQYGLSCQGVRYHRFPDNKLTHIHDNAGCTEQEFINILGIQFSNIQPFTGKDGQPVKDIVGFEIYATDRNGHESILHKGLMYNMFEEHLSDCSVSYYPNYPFNDLNPDVFLSKTFAHHPKLPSLDGTPFLEWGYDPVDTYSRSRFEYISPDVSFERNDAGQYVQLYAEENGPVEGKYTYTDEMPKVTVLSDLAYDGILGIMAASALLLDLDGVIRAGQDMLNGLISALKPVQYATNYWAKTQYRACNFNRITTGNLRRKLNAAQYTLPTKMLVGNDKVNNYQRESGLFLSLCSDLQDPYVKERSRVRYKDNFCRNEFSFCEMTNFTERPVTSSYYAGIKVERPDQYGLPGSTSTRLISGVYDWNNTTTTGTDVILGGDIYITKHKYIRKFPFFTAIPENLPPKTEYDTKAYFNVWNTRYWFNPANASSIALMFPFNLVTAAAFQFNDERNLEDTGSFKKVFCGQDPDSCSQDNVFRVDGTFYTHVIGEVEYWCESKYIGDFRELNEIPESDIERPREDKIKYRTVKYPELFLYNQAYKWQGYSKYLVPSDIDLDCCKTNPVCSENTLAYSLKHDPLRKGDAWLKFLPSNIQFFSNRDGKLTGVKELDNYNLLLFFEDGTYITQQEEYLQAEGKSIILGTPDAFTRRMRKISNEVTGFGGCIDLDSVVVSEFGVMYLDRKRKKLIGLNGDQAVDITGKMQSFLNEYLPDPVENPDFRVLGTFDAYSGKLFFTGKASTNDTKACDWTLSWRPPSEGNAAGWVSFHSFTPEQYLPVSHNFLTKPDNNSFWKHNKKYHYQTYYGKTYPFQVGVLLKSKNADQTLQNIEVYSEWVKFDAFGKRRYDPKAFFDAMLAYNQLRTTGVKELYVKDHNNLKHVGFQNRTDLVEVSAMEDFTYRINKFNVESTYQPTICLNCMDIESTDQLNEMTPTPIKGQWIKVHFINHKPDYKVLLQTTVGYGEEVSQ